MLMRPFCSYGMLSYPTAIQDGRFTHDGPPGAIIAEAAIANFSISPAYVQPVKFQAMREGR